MLVEDHLREALIRLNPSIAAQPDRVDDVLYRLRAIVMTVRDSGLVKANEEFAAWLLGERSMPFGENGEHVTIRLIDFDDIEQNQFVVTQQFIVRAGKTEKRADLVLLVNGIPLVVIEAKTPVRASQSWLDGALQVHDDYEKNVPELFVPNVFSVATEGKEYRYGAVGMPVDLWGPWRLEEEDALPAMAQVEKAVGSMLRPGVVLDLLASFTAYATHKGKQRIKIIARYQQVDGVNKIVERVVAGQPAQGPDLALPGLGQVAADALRRTQAPPASGPQESDGAGGGGPDRSRQPDLRHLLRRGHAQPGADGEPQGAAGPARRRMSARSSSRRSTSSPRPTASSTTAATSS